MGSPSQLLRLEESEERQGLTLCLTGVHAKLLHGIVTESSGDPGRRAHEAGQLCPRPLLERRDDLDGARAVADDADLLVGEVVLVVPLGRVKHLALERLEAFDLGPVHLVELSSGCDDDVCGVFDGLPCLDVGDGDMPIECV